MHSIYIHNMDNNNTDYLLHKLIANILYVGDYYY